MEEENFASAEMQWAQEEHGAMCFWKGREGSRKYDTFFITSLSLSRDMTGCFVIAGPGFQVNALRWVSVAPSTRVKEELQFR